MREPFLEDRHRRLAEEVRAFGDRYLRAGARRRVRSRRAHAGDRRPLLAKAGLLATAVPPPFGRLDLRSLVAAREELAYFSSLADTAFAMQGLGSYPVQPRGHGRAEEPLAARGGARRGPGRLRGHRARGRLRPGRRPHPGGEGRRALAPHRASRPSSPTRASPASTPCWRARADGEGTAGLSMFLVDAEAPGIIGAALEPMAPHPLGEVRFEGDARRAARRRGQGLQAGPGHPRHLPAQRGRRRLRPGPARARRGAALVAGPAPVRPRPGRVPGHPDGLAEMHAELERRRGSWCATRPG